MTEQLSDEKQRGIYEWFYPELEGRDWVEKARFAPFRGFYHIAFLVEGRYEDGESYGKDILDLPPLYTPDGKENWNFVWECIEKLEQEHVRVMYDTADHLWYFWFLDNKGAGAVIKNLGFWFALSELLEGE